VLSTHGRGGLKGMLIGSIAQQVVAQGRTPVLVVQPDKDGATPSFECEHILVPLDGDPEHEGSICVAAELAQRCGSELYLLQVIPTVGSLAGERGVTARMLPSVTSALLDLQEAEAEVYLRGQCEVLQESGQSVHAIVRRGDPVKVITEVAQQTQADLLVLGTHGLSRMDAFWSGSVTPRLASALHLPMLLVPVAE
jgi:nucleotide-binding universal stress UspA family protein